MATKAKESNGLQCAIELSHHITAKSKARRPSPLKDISRLMAVDDMVSLSGGLPHPSLFPVKHAEYSVSDPLAGPGQQTRLEFVTGNAPGVPGLATWLQYGTSTGHQSLLDWCYKFTQEVHRPQYKDFEILMHAGNTAAWSLVVGMLLDDGDHILCEEFTYPSAQAAWIPLGNSAAPIPLDDEGMKDDILESTLATWEANHPGVRRPHVLYVVSVGSNPTGVTYSAPRKKKIYDVCVKYDVIIVEDDPYYFLQFSPHGSDSQTNASKTLSDPEFLESIVPSFLRYDYQGRVIRLESFSKTLAPGLRLGHFVANPIFTERLLRAAEVNIQEPCGISQGLVLFLLQKWKLDGYLAWLQDLRTSYQMRRDWTIDAFGRHFDLVPASECADMKDAVGLVARMQSEDGKGSTPVFSFVPPTGGMFIWMRFHLGGNPRFRELQATGSVGDPEQTFADEFWAQLVEEKVLMVPGSFYHPWQGADKKTTKARGATPATTHFRLSFAYVDQEGMGKGIARMAKIVRSSWKL